GVNPIHVERNVVAGGATAGRAQRFFDDGAHATLINVAHGVNLDPGFADIFFFRVINVAHSYHDAIFGLDLGGEAHDVCQLRGGQSHNGGQGHSVHVPAGRGFGSVEVGVGVNPDQSCLLVLAAMKLGHTG